MKKLNVKEVFIPSAALFLICVIVTALLGLTNQQTAPLINEINAKNEAATRQSVLPSAVSFEKLADDAYKGMDASGNTVGYVVTTMTKGYGGDISVMTGVNAQGTVAGVSILSMNETPGLGANAKKDSFLNQYKGTGYSPQGLAVKKDGGDIDSLTGATVTSRAVTDAVNHALERYNELKGA